MHCTQSPNRRTREARQTPIRYTRGQLTHATATRHLLILGLLLTTISLTGCVHPSAQPSLLNLDESDFTRATGIARIVVIPTAIPAVSIPVKISGRYRCRLWSEDRQKIQTQLADTGEIEVTVPRSIALASEHHPSNPHLDYYLEILYVAPMGESARLEQLIAAWW